MMLLNITIISREKSSIEGEGLEVGTWRFNDWLLFQDTPTSPCFDQSAPSDDCVQEDLYDDVKSKETKVQYC